MSARTLLKNRVWALFSRFIRLRDCAKTGNCLEWGKCFTCGKKILFKQMDAGHFVGGRGSVVLFDERQVNGQCQWCNLALGGNYEAYEKKMLEIYGKAEVEKMKIEAKSTKQLKYYQLKKMEEYYKQKIDLFYNCYKVKV